MNAIKIGAVLFLVMALTAFWKSCGSGIGIGKAMDRLGGAVGNGTGPDRASPNGFVAIPMPDGMSPSGIVIFAPKNCPSDAAQRARSLAGYLSDHRIGYANADSANYSNLSSQEEATKVMSVMNGPIPVVYVNGRAKANPTPEEVVAEFRKSNPE
ncbi:hypothetical protein GCM10027084_26920 [Pseudoxanthomonas sangjuensis]|uniref:hypothetical protein n=1 Tax=Pseudoxanthomonas sangjuensis TaxID=1503750 RepID=UPI001391FEEC|nr:hypothetical protein [Pseudoxanthomonas sangjuensis]KAF1714510.1 hypothetical protein CSC71_03855 [Pseudoxanthomonas sangjuensis]